MARPDAIRELVQPSRIQALTDEQKSHSTSHQSNLHALALQVQHNLQYQHSWTALRIHTHSPLTDEPLPRPLLSGCPPKRLYIHPDEQIELLKKADQQRNARKEHGDTTDTLNLKAEPELEWVLPARLSEKWTLHRLSDIFAGISLVPPEDGSPNSQGHQPNRWRTTKRVVLATASPDSTIVYYIIQDGVVKPRQN